MTLLGWVQERDLGGLIFVEMRDRQGIVQVVFNSEVNPEAHGKAQSLRSEFVVAVIGKVSLRPEGTVNPKLKTGEIEVIVKELRILNVSKNPPFPIEDEEEVAENRAPQVPVSGSEKAKAPTKSDPPAPRGPRGSKTTLTGWGFWRSRPPC